MIIWINGAFGAGKTSCAYELHRRLPGSYVYDPEHIGYFMRSHLPRAVQLDDFQDMAMWRSFNYETLKYVNDRYEGMVIVPMTLVERQYYDEIIGRLLSDGINLRHIILYAGRETLQKRLGKRLERGETWAKAQIERCMTAFDSVIPGERILTDAMDIDAVVEAVASQCGLALLPDNRGTLRKRLDRGVTLLRHIR